jgi:esterase/lipase superfamily enzyme
MMVLGLVRRARRQMGAAAVIAIAVALYGCASRPGAEVLTPVASAPGVKLRPIYVATTRKRADPSDNVFTADSAGTLNYAKFVVGIPPDHRPGRIEWPDGKTNPSVNFATIEQAVLTGPEFRDTVAPPKAPRRAKKQNLLIFVHGFNNNFQESLYRMAQLDADAAYSGQAVLFAWPSKGDPARYEDDKAAANASRDYLIELLTTVTGSPQVGEIMLVAHSMGGMLVAETLRELRLQRRDRVIARLNRVILAAPDIDAQAFRSQVQTIGPLQPPMTVLVSKDDKALKLSGLLSGSRVRAGALDVDNPLVQQAALQAKVQIVDISELQSPDGGMHHDRLFAMAALYPRLKQQPAAERLRYGTFLLDAADAKPVEVSQHAATD